MGGTHRAASATTFKSPNLRLAQLSYASAYIGEFAFFTAVGVYAFDSGGAAAVGIIGCLRVLPTVLTVPLTGALADRIPRERVMAGACAARAVTAAGAAGLAAADAPAVLVYALIIASSIAHRSYRPTHTALLPTLCTHPEELTSSNAIRSVIHGIAAVVGPLLAAVILAEWSPELAFAAVSVFAAVAAVLISGLVYESPPELDAAVRGVRPSLSAELVAGLRALRENRRPALATMLVGVQYFVEGALGVLAVVLAIDLLDLGQPGVGVLWAAVGVGNVVGGALAIGLAGSTRLGTVLGVGSVVWSAPIVVAGLIVAQPVAVVAFAVIGAAYALVNVAAFTVIQRLMAHRMLARALALSEAACALLFAAGSLLTPLAISLLGVRGAMVAAGCVLPLTAVVGIATLRDIDADIAVRDDRIQLLRRVSMFRFLPAPTIEYLAHNMAPTTATAGDVVFAQGDPGDAFYVIRSGSVDVVDRDEPVRRLGAGDAFGEIALLRSVPRTVGIRAAEDAEFGVIQGSDFIGAITGFSTAWSEADTVIHDHLTRRHRRASETGG